MQTHPQVYTPDAKPMATAMPYMIIMHKLKQSHNENDNMNGSSHHKTVVHTHLACTAIFCLAGS